MISSTVWEHYEKIPDTTVAKCILCKKEYSYKTSITNLKKHLRSKHKNAYQNISRSASNATTTATILKKHTTSKANATSYRTANVPGLTSDDEKVLLVIGETSQGETGVLESEIDKTEMDTSDSEQEPLSPLPRPDPLEQIYEVVSEPSSTATLRDISKHLKRRNEIEKQRNIIERERNQLFKERNKIMRLMLQLKSQKDYNIICEDELL